MPKRQIALSLVGAVLIACAVTSQSGVALADAAGAPALHQSVLVAELPRFAGYRTISEDRSTSTIMVVPEGTDCDEDELTLARSFMGERRDDSFVSGGIVVVCTPGFSSSYRAGLETFEHGFVELPGPRPGDKIKTVITDDGTDTTVTVTNLATGAEVSRSTPSVSGNYDVGIQGTLDSPQVDGKSQFAKNRVDGARLGAADPTKITYTDDAGNTFKPRRLKKGMKFAVITLEPPV